MIRLAESADAGRADVRIERACDLRVGKGRERIAVWLVDGRKVRDSLEIDFTNFAQPLRFGCIPRGEFWIDRDTRPEERSCYILHMVVEYLCMAEGMPYGEAEERGRAAEEASRGIASAAERLEVKRAVIGAEGRLVVWLVDGKAVRDTLCDDFAEGGNDRAYDFIPEGEIWIDDDVSRAEVPFVRAHEARERECMDAGMSYEQAHAEANRVEQEMRVQKRASALKTGPQGVTGCIELRSLRVSDGRGHDGRFYLFRSLRDSTPIYYVNRRPYFGEASSDSPRANFLSKMPRW
jgi:hypothetical protein